MHPLQHDRAILLACMQEMLDLAEELTHPTFLNYRNALVAEAVRVGHRLHAVQREIERLDLD